MSRSADRNLLFGILALQLNFVTRDQLIAGMHAWVLNKSTSLGEIFVAQQSMEAEQYRLLDALVEKHVEKHGGSVTQSIQQLSSVDPQVTSSLRAIDDPDLQGTLHQSIDSQRQHDVTQHYSQPQPIRRSSARYRIIRPHAKGGLGEVFVAQDTELSREVALKEIQERFADNIDSRERFLREAEITGRLEHPGIVPVYGLGTYDDGRPFYAMKFIKGQSLKEAIDRFHADPETKRATSFMAGRVGIKFRELLGRFIDVCNAVHYAHSRGVLHRDLKPGNVMIGEYGETLVVDWGLAKLLGEKAAAIAERTVIEPTSGSGITPTVMGNAVGTPAYMSPEQAAGRIDELGPATDVYSLGATLYFLLTGAPPYTASTLPEILQQVISGQVGSPQATSALVPGPLAAICLKAMSYQPSLRYSSARELASEVQGFLGDEPVAAYRESAVELMVRWSRKHPTTVALATACMLLGGLGLGVLNFLLNEKNSQLASLNTSLAESVRRETEAKEAAVNSKQIADEQLKRTERLLSNNAVSFADRYWKDGNARDAFAMLEKCTPENRNWEYFYLESEFHKGYVTIAENQDTFCWSPDGRWLASSTSANGFVLTIWDSTNGQAVEKYPLPSSRVNELDWSSDGTRIVSCNDAGMVHVWNAQDGQLVSSWKAAESRITRAKFDPKGLRVATTTGKHVPKVWSANGGNLIFELKDCFHEAIAWSPDGDKILTSGADNIARIWDAKSGQLLHELPSTWALQDAISWSPDSQNVVVAADVGGFKIINAERGNLVHSTAPVPSQNAIRSICWSLDGSRITTAGNDGLIRVYNAETCALKFELRGSLDLGIEKVGWSADCQRLASCDGSLKVWDGINGQETQSLSNAGSCVAWSPKGKRLWYGGETNLIVEDFEKQTRQRYVGSESVRSVTWKPDGTQWAGACYDTVNGNLRSSVKIWEASIPAPIFTVVNGEDGIRCVGWSPDGKLLASCLENVITIWDANSHRELCKLSDHENDVFRLCWSSDGRLLSSSFDLTLRVWDIEHRKELVRFQGLSDLATSIAWSPDGKKIASGTDRSELKIWDADSGHELLKLRGHSFGIWSLDWSPDGTRIASGGTDGVIKLWEAQTGMEVFTLHGLRFVGELDWSPDGKALAACSGDDTRVFRVPDLPINQETPQQRSLRHQTLLSKWAAFDGDWHLQQAHDAETRADLFCADYHLRMLLAKQPDNSVAQELQLIVTNRLKYRERAQDAAAAESLIWKECLSGNMVAQRIIMHDLFDQAFFDAGDFEWNLRLATLLISMSSDSGIMIKIREHASYQEFSVSPFGDWLAAWVDSRQEVPYNALERLELITGERNVDAFDIALFADTLLRDGQLARSRGEAQRALLLLDDASPDDLSTEFDKLCLKRFREFIEDIMDRAGDL